MSWYRKLIQDALLKDLKDLWNQLGFDLKKFCKCLGV